MAQVITQIEMMRYQGAPLAVFPEEPSSPRPPRTGPRSRGSRCASAVLMRIRDSSFLDQVVGSVIRQYRSLGKSIVKEEAAEAVCQVLSKLECTVE